MNPLGDNFIGCRFNSIQFRKKIIAMICSSKKIFDMELAVKIGCLTMNRRRLALDECLRSTFCPRSSGWEPIDYTNITQIRWLNIRRGKWPKVTGFWPKSFYFWFHKKSFEFGQKIWQKLIKKYSFSFLSGGLGLYGLGFGQICSAEESPLMT